MKASAWWAGWEGSESVKTARTVRAPRRSYTTLFDAVSTVACSSWVSGAMQRLRAAACRCGAQLARSHDSQLFGGPATQQRRHINEDRGSGEMEALIERSLVREQEHAATAALTRSLAAR